MDRQTVLLITAALLSAYLIGIGGCTASALRARELWRRCRQAVDLAATEVELVSPSLPAVARVMRVLGWVAFPFALVLGVFANREYEWVTPLSVTVMVGINAFYFTAMQGIGERLTLTTEGFKFGRNAVRWIHVAELSAAHIGAFGGTRAPESGDWQDPRAAPNAVLYRLNRALVTPNRTLLQRWSGLSYYDGVVRNAFGVSTEQLVKTMKLRRQAALESEGPHLRQLLVGAPGGVRRPEA